MVHIRIIFKTWETQNFLAFTMSEAYSLVDEFDYKDIISVHYYPNYH